VTKKPVSTAKPKTKAKPVRLEDPALARARAILERAEMSEQMEIPAGTNRTLFKYA
jgi:hypothetical protein